MILGDAGSSWCKVFDLDEGVVHVHPVSRMVKEDFSFDWGTGHTARRHSVHFENDLISLTRGALALVDEEDFTVLDLGSRDAKLVGFKARRPVKLDWSVGCAAATGATMEMLGRFYEVDFDALPETEEWASVTCGTYAVERIMDAISNGDAPELAVARFIHGLARHAFSFSGEPDTLYLSGGFTGNAAFTRALGRYTRIVSMGRTAPLAGLYAFAAEADPALGPMPRALKGEFG